MSSGNASNELNELSARINDLVERIEFIGDPAVRANVVTLVQALMDLHRRGFERTTEIVANVAGGTVIYALATDELVGGLLTLYGLHPDSLESRVKSAVEKTCGNVLSAADALRLLSIENGIARLHLITHGNGGCGSSSAQLEKAVRDSITAAVPDLTQIEIHCEVLPSNRANDLVQLQVSTAAD